MFSENLPKNDSYITHITYHFQFGRWSLLTLGVVYGALHQGRLSRKEAAFREVEDKQKAIRDAKVAEEKKRAAEREIAELEALAK